MTRKQKKTLIRVIVAVILFAAGFFIPLDGIPLLCYYAAVYLFIGWDVLFKAVRGIFSGQFLDENFLMAIASVGAFFVSEYTEAVAVILFYQVGELFQSCAVSKSRKNIAALMDIRPDYANLERDGEVIEADPEEVHTGDIIVIKPGEKIPLDCVVVEGSSTIDTASVTGESIPVDAYEGKALISGCINISGVLRCEVTAEFGESTVSKILELVENAGEHKAKAENFITKFARYYTPCVVAAALIIGIIPPIFDGEWSKWIGRALTFLVISCPCALVISVPMTFFGGIGGASANGILVKGANYLEALAEVKTVVFDKTGTLTEGSFEVTSVTPSGISEAELLSLAVHAEYYSPHPIAASLKKAYGKEINSTVISDVCEKAGRGVSAVVDGRTVLAGGEKLMRENGISFESCQSAGTVVYVAENGVYKGSIIISDKIKPSSAKAIKSLKNCGVEKTVMLTGDNKLTGEAVAAEIGIDEAHCGLLPTDKVDIIRRLLENKNGKLAFAGDGINDAPALTCADIGIAMGGVGSDAAIEAADAVIMDDNPERVALAVKIARKTLGIVKQNIVFALGVKGIVLVLGALGFAGMWAAVFADVGVCIIAVLNAMRALKAPK
ncbi:MAG: cadmium-translocating P-type ATPase [Ruminiclostridium sp.]|nr:cadmium-translocating P-type ATPase [Ruminiclostridium sp.]